MRQSSRQYPFKRLLLAVSMALPLLAIAQPEINFDRGYGGIVWEECNFVLRTPDQGLFLAGLTSSPVSNDVSEPNRGIFDYWVLKTDSLANKIWDRRYGGNKEDRLWSADLTNDGGFILGGHSRSDISGEKSDSCRGSDDYWIIKTDSLGNIEWDKTYGGDSTDILFTVKQTLDGGFIMGGNSISGISGEKTDTSRGLFDWWIIKTDSIGNIEWQKTFGGDDNDRLNEIQLASDGGYYLGGGSKSTISGDITLPLTGVRDFFLAKLDADGNEVWQRRYGGTNEDEINSFQKTLDGGFILGGGSRSEISGDKTDFLRGIVDFWVIKTDADGNIEWDRTFGTEGLENLYSLQQNSVGHYLLGGFSGSDASFDKSEPGRGGWDFWLIYLDPFGNKFWDKTFGGPDNDVLVHLFQNKDGSYLLSGHSSSDVGEDKTAANYGFNDVWIIKTDCNLSVQINADTTICFGASLQLDTLDTYCPGCKYGWLDGPDSVSRVVAPDQQTKYYLLAYDSLGCTVWDTITVGVQTLPVIPLDASYTICEGTSVSLDAGNPGYEYLWSTNDSSQVIQVDSQGLYQVEVTDPLGCTSSGEAIVNVIEVPKIIDTNFVCTNLNTAFRVELQIAGGDTSNYEITGSSGLLLGTNFISSDIPNGGSFSFTIDDNSGCAPLTFEGNYNCPCLSETGTMNLDPLTICGDGPASTSIPQDVILDYNDTLYFALHDGATEDLGTIFNLNATPQFVFDPSAMEYGSTYYISAIAGYGDTTGNIYLNDSCLVVSIGTPVTFYDPPEAVISPDTGLLVDCYIPTLTLSGNASLPLGVDYQWFDEEYQLLGDESFVEVTNGGLVQLIVTETVSGCKDTTSVGVEEDKIAPTILINPPRPLTCVDSILTIDASSSSSGPAFNYEWTGQTPVQYDSTLTPQVNDPGQYELVIFNEQNGCSSTEVVNVEEDRSVPEIQIAEPEYLNCVVEEVTVEATVQPQDNYILFNWITNDGRIVQGANSLAPLVDEPGTYTILVQNTLNGCTNEASAQIIEIDDYPKTSSISFENPRCFDDDNGLIYIDSVSGGLPPYLFALENDPFQTYGQFFHLPAGQFPITIQDARGCEWDTIILLQQPDELRVELGDSRVVTYGDETQIEAQISVPLDQIQEILWEPSVVVPCSDCLSFSFFPENELTLRIEIEDQNGCSAEDWQRVSVRKERHLYIPTAFSPNGDGSNDFFRVFAGDHVVQVNEIGLFDRWGAFVFSRSNYDPEDPSTWWDGRFRSKELPSGVYVYYVEVQFIDGATKIFKGDVTLVR